MENWFSHLAKAPKIDLVKHTTVEPLTILGYNHPKFLILTHQINIGEPSLKLADFLYIYKFTLKDPSNMNF